MSSWTTAYPGLFGSHAVTWERQQVGCAPRDPAPIIGSRRQQRRGHGPSRAGVDQRSQRWRRQERTEDEPGDAETSLGVTPSARASTNPVKQHRGRRTERTRDSRRREAVPRRNPATNLFGAAEEVPTPRTEAAEAVADDSATLTGTLKPEETPEPTCFFEYASEAEYKASGFQGAPQAPCDPEGPFTGNGEEAVSAHLEGLRGGTTYHVRLVGESHLGGETLANPGEDEPFTTLGPGVSETRVEDVEEGSATLAARVDPRGSQAAYSFQYLTQAAFEAQGWSAAAEAPPGGGTIEAGAGATKVSTPIEGLAPGTAYRFRVVATGSEGEAAGTTEGQEVAFSTFAPAPTFGGCSNEALRLGSPSGALPDCRAYEQASPTDKNGTNVQGAQLRPGRPGAAEPITFLSNAGIPGGEGAQEFPTFMASRAPGGSGWSTRGLLPPASYGPRASVIGWDEKPRRRL